MEINEIIAHILQSPKNSNFNIIKEMLLQITQNNSIINKVIEYIIKTPDNTNGNILIELLESTDGNQKSSNLVGIGQVGYMII